jgi:hypothetical protein
MLTLIYTNENEFSIEFLKVDGSQRVRKPRVRLGVPPSQAKIAKLQGRALSNQKDWGHQINKSHNLLLFDIEKNRPFEIKIPLLMEVNNIKVRWHVKNK